MGEQQIVKFSYSVMIERDRAAKDEIDRYNAFIDGVSDIPDVSRVVESGPRSKFQRKVRYLLDVTIKRPAEDSGRQISEFLLDAMFELPHVDEIKEISWTRI